MAQVRLPNAVLVVGILMTPFTSSARGQELPARHLEGEPRAREMYEVLLTAAKAAKDQIETFRCSFRLTRHERKYEEDLLALRTYVGQILWKRDRVRYDAAADGPGMVRPLKIIRDKEKLILIQNREGAPFPVVEFWPAPRTASNLFSKSIWNLTVLDPMSFYARGILEIPTAKNLNHVETREAGGKHELAFSDAKGGTYTVSFDPAFGLMPDSSLTKPKTKSSSELSIDTRTEWTKVKGCFVPAKYSIVRKQPWKGKDEQLDTELVFKDIVVNAPIDDAEFTLESLRLPTGSPVADLRKGKPQGAVIEDGKIVDEANAKKAKEAHRVKAMEAASTAPVSVSSAQDAAIAAQRESARLVRSRYWLKTSAIGLAIIGGLAAAWAFKARRAAS
jgi:hypothetical protein